MNKGLWFVQAFLALAFMAAGLMKLTTPYIELAAQMVWVNDFHPMTVQLIGLVEVAGALGLILPAALRILPVLTPVAATGLVLDMLGAAATHARIGEFPMIGINVVLGVAAAFVAWGRFKKVPIKPKA